ncbi:uncharacterized protein LOC119343164 [Triticum dicoccoides]|uniref:uncharacterized protein LOC119343164 n=1 Tax=Triticum dicoccoides TaxID=85692 RepID=UPI0018909757|nr:uncharacterized protein LOC119343164 [Triticum dicoccoides]
MHVPIFVSFVQLKTRATNGERVHMVAERELLSDHGEDGGRRMYLRREEMGAGTAGARRWLVPTALVSNTMRREQRLHHEKGAEVAGSGGSRGRSSPTWRENDVAELVPFRRMWPEGEYGSSAAGGRVWVQREEKLASWQRGRTGSVPADVAGRRVWVQREKNWRSWRRTGVPSDVRWSCRTCFFVWFGSGVSFFWFGMDVVFFFGQCMEWTSFVD